MEQNLQLKKTKILNYINVFRGLAILLIIMGHTMQFGEPQSLTRNIVCEIFCGGTALFIFISGFLFQHLSYKYEFKNYMKKKWTNVIMPYLFCAIPGLYFCFYYPVEYKNPFLGLDWYIQIPLHISIGRVMNVPTWFIPMIVIFFLFSYIFLKLEKKDILYKLLPILFLITIFLPRGTAEIEDTIGLTYLGKYLVYVKYILSNFIHFISLYVFGMYCSKNKNIIDKFYQKRWLLFILMIALSAFDIYLAQKYNSANYTLSKTILTMYLLGYLKHYDEFIISHKKTNKTLDFIAKYSFGIFFIHWYWFFIYKQFIAFNLDLPMFPSLFVTIINVTIRFLAVTILSVSTLFIIKSIILKIKKDANTRQFIGV